MVLFSYLGHRQFVTHKEVDQTTIQQILKFYTECLNMLAEGVFRPYDNYPPSDFDIKMYGHRIAGPWMFGFAGLIGDQEWKRDCLQQMALGRCNNKCELREK